MNQNQYKIKHKLDSGRVAIESLAVERCQL